MIGLIIGVFSSADHAHLLQNILDFFQHPDIKSTNITLCFVDNREFSFENWYFYRRLARDTGGEYMMFRNAANILTTAVLLALRSEDTLRQAFRHISEENIQMFENNHDNVDEGNQQIENDNDLNFDHGLI
ncbi:unnamed protein product [Rotaria magnacalcarata]|uniref:Uncharacterized protein n=1 Tax=Rotaria magnacalcarata TaxID=392030 RepID=A0A820B8B6_9BILA|nr:unnamed protein product [Rotaria magnacalcarata]CAF4203231.1 unnamed protein product [Rotaria magnacalcarata]